MQENPYKYTGPLDPSKDNMVCIQRHRELDEIISGIRRGDFWTILGPRQIGKTTLINQIINELSGLYCIYFDLESDPKTEDSFYAELIEHIADHISLDNSLKSSKNKKDLSPASNFYNFLKSIKTKNDSKIIIFFDEIEKASYARSFLHLWRKVFNNRIHKVELNKYVIVIAGSVDLISLTIGPSSPFNISKKLYLKELSEIEATKLISEPMKKLKIEMDLEAQKNLIVQTAGHPQLLQHLCYLLVEKAYSSNMIINKNDVEDSITNLFLESDNISTLEGEIHADQNLRHLVKRIINGEKIKFLRYKKYSINGTGPIVQRGSYCALRNEIYKEFLSEVLIDEIDDNSVKDSPSEFLNAHTSTYNTIIYLNEALRGILSIEDEKKFLTNMFEHIDNLNIKVQKDDSEIVLDVLDRRHKLTYCYLAYKNYKALNKGFSDWKKIPKTWEYRLSDNPENNRVQIPEWEIFVKVLGKEPIIGDIRVWIYKIRNRSNLNKIGAEDIIDAGDGGRGIGYLLKGKVTFQKKL